jgi:hypothetical protein
MVGEVGKYRDSLNLNLNRNPPSHPQEPGLRTSLNLKLNPPPSTSSREREKNSHGYVCIWGICVFINQIEYGNLRPYMSAPIFGISSKRKPPATTPIPPGPIDRERHGRMEHHRHEPGYTVQHSPAQSSTVQHSTVLISTPEQPAAKTSTPKKN